MLCSTGDRKQQESAPPMGKIFYLHKSLGLVADIFSDANLKNLKGNMAIGHNRYSTTGDNNANNTQPISAEINKGKVALAHNWK